MIVADGELDFDSDFDFVVPFLVLFLFQLGLWL
jgi:hypothetical protein